MKIGDLVQGQLPFLEFDTPDARSWPVNGVFSKKSWPLRRWVRDLILAKPTFHSYLLEQHEWFIHVLALVRLDKSGITRPQKEPSEVAEFIQSAEVDDLVKDAVGTHSADLCGVLKKMAAPAWSDQDYRLLMRLFSETSTSANLIRSCNVSPKYLAVTDSIPPESAECGSRRSG